MTRRRIVALILLAGIALGSATAIASRPATVTRSAVAATPPSLHPVLRAPLTPIGPVTVVARAQDADPSQPEWAIRRFTTRSAGRTFPCLQLGRLDAGRFGWVTPGRAFRPARFDQADVPTQCAPSFRQGAPALTLTTLITDPSAGLPTPHRAVIWGLLPPDAASARLLNGTALAARPGGVVLSVAQSHAVGEPGLHGTLILRDGLKPRHFGSPQPGLSTLTSRDAHGQIHRQEIPTSVSRRATVAVRAPDPAGGTAWGILTARTPSGTLCISSPGRVVGNVIATVNPYLGTAMREPFAFLQCPPIRTPSPSQPARMDVSIYSVGDEDPAGTRELRRLTDRTVLTGRTTNGIRSVTVTTARDTRTLIPDPRTHLVIAVYDGTFPGESFTITTQSRNGERRQFTQTTGA